MKPRNPPLQSFRLLDQVKERIRYFSLQIEKYMCTGQVFSFAGKGAAVLCGIRKIWSQVLHERIPLFFNIQSNLSGRTTHH